MDIIMQRLIREVHERPQFERYECTYVRNNTNCYSHAIGATAADIEIYRIGAICGKKPTDEKYKSVEEIKNLIFDDCKTVDLKVEETTLEDPLKENQHKILLFVKIYADGKIYDYHFWRSDDGNTWSEKWRYRNMRRVDYEREVLNYYPWNYVAMYKITK